MLNDDISSSDNYIGICPSPVSIINWRRPVYVDGRLSLYLFSQFDYYCHKSNAHIFHLSLALLSPI